MKWLNEDVRVVLCNQSSLLSFVGSAIHYGRNGVLLKNWHHEHYDKQGKKPVFIPYIGIAYIERLDEQPITEYDVMFSINGLRSLFIGSGKTEEEWGETIKKALGDEKR